MDKFSTCHIEIRKTKREDRKVVVVNMMMVGVGVGGGTDIIQFERTTDISC
jgi:hypothetical protein